MSVQLESNLLRTFVVVSDTGSFTRAADFVGRTQSAVSLQIKKLEQIVGTTLFERGPRGIELTSQGVSLLLDSRRIISLLDETASSLVRPTLEGPLRIGLPEEYGHDVLPQALGAFARRHPYVEVTVRYGRSTENSSRIEADELDLAVTFDWKGNPKAELLRQDPTVWVTSNIHRIHERSPLPIALYISSGWCTDFALKSLDERNITYRVAYTSDNSSGLRLAIASGLAVAPISRSNIPADCRELTASEGFGAIDGSRLILQRNFRSSGDALESMALIVRDAFRAETGGDVPR